MTEAQMERVKEVARWLCAKNGITEYDDIQEVEGECLLAAVEAIQGKEEYTDGLLVQAAKWKFFNGARALAKEPEFVSMDEEYEGEDGEAWTMHDTVGDERLAPEKVLSDAETLQVLNNFLDGLLPQEAHVLRGMFGLNDGVEKSQAQLAEELECSQQYVSKLYSQALRKLRGRNIKEVLGL